MLVQLNIRNIVLIQSLDLEFNSGLTVLSTWASEEFKDMVKKSFN